MPVEGGCGEERILNVSEFLNDPANGISMLGIASVLAFFLHDVIGPREQDGGAEGVMWIKIFHLRCSGSSLAMSRTILNDECCRCLLLRLRV